MTGDTGIAATSGSRCGRRSRSMGEKRRWTMSGAGIDVLQATGAPVDSSIASSTATGHVPR